MLGPEVSAFEAEFAAACGAAHAVGVGTGTDAIALILRGLGIGPGDEVITTPLSAAYTALAVMMAGARPVFADIDPARHTLDPAAVERAITPRTRAILPVHLYGQAADMGALAHLAERHGLAVVEDACQAHLATAAGRPVGTIGVAGAFSFYPTKNLGALGDGGAIVTNDASLAATLRRLRNGGQTNRYHHVEAGINSQARRDAGRGPPRAAALPAGVDGAGVARWPRCIEPPWPPRSIARAARVSTPVTSTTCSSFAPDAEAHSSSISRRTASKRWSTTRCRYRGSRPWPHNIR